MDDSELLMIVLAFVVGYMASGMMKQMCGGRLVEGSIFFDCDISDIGTYYDRNSKSYSIGCMNITH